MQDVHGVFTEFTRRVHNAPTTRPRRSRRPVSVATALPQRCHIVLSNTLCKRQAAAFVLSILKINAVAWRSMRFHSVSTALRAFPQRAPRRSAIFENAVGTLLGRNSGVTWVLVPLKLFLVKRKKLLWYILKITNYCYFPLI